MRSAFHAGPCRCGGGTGPGRKAAGAADRRHRQQKRSQRSGTAARIPSGQCVDRCRMHLHICAGRRGGFLQDTGPRRHGGWRRISGNGTRMWASKNLECSSRPPRLSQRVPRWPMLIWRWALSVAAAPCWLRRRHAICWWRNVPLKLHSSYLIILRTRTPWPKGSSGGLVPICPKVLIWPSQHPACIRAPEPCRDASRRPPGRHRWAFFRTFGCSMLSTCWRRPPTASRMWQLPSGTPMACRSEL